MVESQFEHRRQDDQHGEHYYGPAQDCPQPLTRGLDNLMKSNECELIIVCYTTYHDIILLETSVKGVCGSL